MSNIAVSVENISKCYRLGAASKTTLYESFERLIRPSKFAHEKTAERDFWALKDVSFEIKQGEVVGIIGRNGAGKSTLLKILSRITKPTSGKAILHGRVASLLEVGTGFHPELTGRENIFLNGAILGMNRNEIKSKFDEIVAFSGVEKFLDTPVKRYSSGMFVRLAFSVAAHLEPEILIIDEVLAVGDAEFQKKCLGKMKDVAGEGRTVLFVSHNMAAVQSLCSRGIYLVAGKTSFVGEIQKCISEYQKEVISMHLDQKLSDRTDRCGNGDLQFTDFQILNEYHQATDSIVSGKKVTIKVLFNCKENLQISGLQFDFGICSSDETALSWLSSYFFENHNVNNVKKGANEIHLTIENLPLHAGRYTITIFAKNTLGILDWINNAIILDVFDGYFYEKKVFQPLKYGHFFINHSISINP